MVQIGTVIDGVMARLEEAREAQTEQFARDLHLTYGRCCLPFDAHGGWTRDEWDIATPATQRHYRDFARALERLGYRKVAP